MRIICCLKTEDKYQLSECNSWYNNEEVFQRDLPRNRVLKGFKLVALFLTLILVSTCREGTRGFWASTHTYHEIIQITSSIYRGPYLDPEGIAYLKSRGVRTIVNLEIKLFFRPGIIFEARALAENAGIHFVHLPLNPILAPKPSQIDAIMAVICSSENQPVYLQCHSGLDRTGFIVGVYRVLHDGWTPEKAYEEMIQVGFSRVFFWWKHALIKYTDRKRPPAINQYEGSK